MSDPRDSSREVKLSLPRAWQKQYDGYQAFAYAMSTVVMMTRNKFMAWPMLFFDVFSVVQNQPLRTKDGSSGGGGFSILAFALIGLLATYFPAFFITPAQQTKLFG